MSERTGNNKPEPMPPTDSIEPAVWDLVLARFRHISPNIIRDIQERDAAGEAKYGTRLRLRNGREPLVDLYQELLDAIVYAGQHLFENTSIEATCEEHTNEERVRRLLIIAHDVSCCIERSKHPKE